LFLQSVETISGATTYDLPRWKYEVLLVVGSCGNNFVMGMCSTL